MRVAIFSDVHGNLTALEAVLAHIDKQSPDITAFAGDLCLFGPRPKECLDVVRQRDPLLVYGNTDEWVLNPPVPPDESPANQHRRHLYDFSSWTSDQLEEADHVWLRELPFECRISPTNNLNDDLLMVHANPKDVSQLIFPSEDKQKEIFGEVRNKQTDNDLGPLLDDVAASVVAFGHLHVPNVRIWQTLTLANISSVSLSGDGDPRAKYGLFTWEKSRGWSLQHKYVPYDIEEELDALAAKQPPKWQSYGRRLEQAGM